MSVNYKIDEVDEENVKDESFEICPICFENIDEKDRVQPCKTCINKPLHEKCYKRMQIRNIRKCPTCRKDYPNSNYIIRSNENILIHREEISIKYTFLVFFLLYIIFGFIGYFIVRNIYAARAMYVNGNDIFFSDLRENITVWEYQFNNWNLSYNSIRETAFVYDKENDYIYVDVNKTRIDNMCLIKRPIEDKDLTKHYNDRFNNNINHISPRKQTYTFEFWTINYISQFFFTLISLLFLFITLLCLKCVFNCCKYIWYPNI